MDPAPDPDPALFVSGFQDANKKISLAIVPRRLFITALQ
jgi:hypothetical protein